ncbi:MAG: glycosyltransferase, partial [Ginsengibacter sp.]
MIIAVNTRCLTKDQPGECSNAMYDIFNSISTLQKEHTFIYIFDQAYDEELSFPANVVPVIVGPIINTSVKKYFWFNVKIPQLLKKYKAEIFVSPGLCSLATKVPQCLILNDLSFLHCPAFVNRKQLSFYKKHTRGFVKKAKSIIVLSEYSKTLISTNYKTPLDKIDVVYVGSDSGYKPVSHKVREEIKDKYADGFEYFLFTGNLNSGNNLIVLLKAFSAFKKRQKSSMKLLIACKTIIEDESFIESFRLFRFKKE